MGVGQGARETSGISSGAPRTPRRAGDKLSRPAASDPARDIESAQARFLATVSHELRTPLTALAGYQELFADNVLGPLSEQQRECIERMRHVTEHLASMIEEVLTYTSLETGVEQIRATDDFLAADLLFAAASIVQPLCDRKGIALVVQSAATPLRMTTDIDKARQILVNLATNAVKFTEHGEVRLALLDAGADVHFTVSDTGIGIASPDLKRLFRPFSQLDGGLTRKHGGTGLGLYISHRLANLLRGRIDVTSKTGQGSTFTLVLPRA